MRTSADPRKDYSDDLLRDEIESSRLSAEELASKAGRLPRIEIDGSSPCPFADTLFEELEKLVPPVVYTIEHMERYVPVVEAHIDARRKKLGVIMANSGGLNSVKVKGEVKDAERWQAGDYDAIIHLRDELDILLRELSGAVANATHAINHWRKSTGRDQSEDDSSDDSERASPGASKAPPPVPTDGSPWPIPVSSDWPAIGIGEPPGTSR